MSVSSASVYLQANARLNAKVGDTFLTLDGVTVTVTEYHSAKYVKVEDGLGNSRTAQNSELKKGIVWLSSLGRLHKTNSQIPATPPLVRRKGLKSLLKSSGYYVYQATVKGEVVYIGMGKGARLAHCISGRSHNRELNRLYFQRAPMIVEVLQDGLSAKQALRREKELIKLLNPLCNRYGKS